MTAVLLTYLRKESPAVWMVDIFFRISLRIFNPMKRCDVAKGNRFRHKKWMVLPFRVALKRALKELDSALAFHIVQLILISHNMWCVKQNNENRRSVRYLKCVQTRSGVILRRAHKQVEFEKRGGACQMDKAPPFNHCSGKPFKGYFCYWNIKASGVSSKNYCPCRFFHS